MFQTIHEQVTVVGKYAAGKFVPHVFGWGNKLLKIEKITLTTNARDGQVRMRNYAVIVGGNLYRLLFNRETELWWLEEIWLE